MSYARDGGATTGLAITSEVDLATVEDFAEKRASTARARPHPTSAGRVYLGF